MTRTRKWLTALGVVAGLLVLLVGGAMLLIPSDDELARRATEELSKAAGVPVAVGAVRWQLLPTPRVVLEKVATSQPKPITLDKVTLYPNAGALLQRRIQLERVLLEGAVVPQLSLRALGKAGAADGAPHETAFTAAGLPLARFEFREVTWVSRHGIAVVYEGEIDFDPAWRPRTGQLRRPGVAPAAELSVTRQGQEDRWATRINVGGGTAHGDVRLQTRANGRLHLDGTLQPRDIDTAAALTAFNRTPVLAGKASGATVLSADGDSVGALSQSLQTQSSLRVSAARLLRFDLEKAVRSAGREHGGQTALDSLTVQLDTQNTAQGMVVNFRDVKARSGVLSASGKARLFNRQIDAEIEVDLVEGLVGVPLTVSGPVNAVKVSVPPGAIAGAAVGTAVLPGIGTAIGARIGATLGKLFGAGPDSASGSKPPASAPRTR